MKVLLVRVYVPLISFALVLLLGNRLARNGVVDPLAAAQNSALAFEASVQMTEARAAGLTLAEAQTAAAVVRERFRAPSNRPSILFIGDSQTMAVMDPKPGDMTTPQWLQVLLARETRPGIGPVTVTLGSLAGLSMPEFVVQLVAACAKRPCMVRGLLGGITLRQWRNLGIRDEVLTRARTPAVQPVLTGLISANPGLAAGDAAIMGALQAKDGPSDTGRNDIETGSVIARLDQFLRRQADDYVPLYRMRSSVRAQLELWYVRLRNRLLHIKADTPRPIPEATYLASLQTLELALRYSKSHRIEVILYLSPVRPLQPNPVVPSDLSRFRRDISNLCRQYDVRCLDYTDLVPERLWTNDPDSDIGNPGERDYAHFTGPAHRLVAQQLMEAVGARWAGSLHTNQQQAWRN